MTSTDDADGPSSASAPDRRPDLEPAVSPDGLADQPGTGDSAARRRLQTLACWSLFAAVTALVLRPILIAPIIGDDFLNPWFMFRDTGASPGRVLSYAISSTTNAGHFNYLGQLVGDICYGTWIWLMADLHIRYTAIYAVTKLVVYLLVVQAVASFVRTASRAAGRPIGLWRSRVYVAIPLYATLQVHLPWSHDPVANYPTSGLASAALGFLVLKYGIEAVSAPTWRSSMICGVAGVVAIVYYEINVAAVVALAPIFVWGWWQRRRDRRWTELLPPALCGLVVPALVTITLHWYAASRRIDYSGTDLEVGGSIARTLRIALLGTLPGAGWTLSREFLQGPIAVRGYGLAVLCVVAAGLFLLHARTHDTAVRPERVAWGPAGAAVTAALLYWVGATSIQAATAKVQAEISRVGAVYNYYAIGVAALAAVAVLVVRLAPRRLDLDIVRIAGLSAFIGFAVIQYLVNFDVADRFHDYTQPNQNLHAAFSDHPPMDERCRVLREWEQLVWPEYVEVSMLEGLEDAYQHFHGESFCAGYQRTP